MLGKKPIYHTRGERNLTLVRSLQGRNGATVGRRLGAGQGRPTRDIRRPGGQNWKGRHRPVIGKMRGKRVKS